MFPVVSVRSNPTNAPDSRPGPKFPSPKKASPLAVYLKTNPLDKTREIVRKNKARPSAISLALSARNTQLSKVVHTKAKSELFIAKQPPTARIEPDRVVPLNPDELPYSTLIIDGPFIDSPSPSPRFHNIDLTPRTLFADLRTLVSQLPRSHP